MNYSYIAPVTTTLKPFAYICVGGGAKGRFPAGVAIAHAQAGIFQQNSLIAGTSVGSLIAALGAKFGFMGQPSEGNDVVPPPPFRTIADVWEGITKKTDVYNGTIDSNWMSDVSLVWKILTGGAYILDRGPLKAIIKKLFGDMTISQLAAIMGTQIVFTALNLNTSREEFFTSFNEYQDIKVYDALCASSGIPFVFESYPIRNQSKNEDNWYCDGGCGANDPFISVAMYNEAFPGKQVKKAIILFTTPDTEPYTNKRFSIMRDMAPQLVGAILGSEEQLMEMWAIYMSKCSDIEVMALWPKEDTGDSLDFSKLELLQHGYDYGKTFIGYDYKTDTLMGVVDFLTREA